jgi:hypothetical protein
VHILFCSQYLVNRKVPRKGTTVYWSLLLICMFMLSGRTTGNPLAEE